MASSFVSGARPPSLIFPKLGLGDSPLKFAACHQDRWFTTPKSGVRVSLQLPHIPKLTTYVVGGTTFPWLDLDVLTT